MQPPANIAPRAASAVIELFVELLTVRIQLMDKSKEIPGDMIEAISSLVYAAQRITDLPELQVPARNALFQDRAGLQLGASAVCIVSRQIGPSLSACTLPLYLTRCSPCVTYCMPANGVPGEPAYRAGAVSASQMLMHGKHVSRYATGERHAR